VPGRGWALITDIRMPPMTTDDGARAARTLRAQRPTLPIVLLSQHVETTHSLELVATGSFGYLLKDRVLDVEDFLDALTRVAASGSALDPEAVASNPVRAHTLPPPIGSAESVGTAFRVDGASPGPGLSHGAAGRRFDPDRRLATGRAALTGRPPRRGW